MTDLLNKFSEARDCYGWINKPCFLYWRRGFAFGSPDETYTLLTTKNGRWNQVNDSLANRSFFLTLNSV